MSAVRFIRSLWRRLPWVREPFHLPISVLYKALRGCSWDEAIKVDNRLKQSRLEEWRRGL